MSKKAEKRRRKKQKLATAAAAAAAGTSAPAAGASSPSLSAASSKDKGLVASLLSGLDAPAVAKYVSFLRKQFLSGVSGDADSVEASADVSPEAKQQLRVWTADALFALCRNATMPGHAKWAPGVRNEMLWQNTTSTSCSEKAQNGGYCLRVKPSQKPLSKGDVRNQARQWPHERGGCRRRK